MHQKFSDFLEKYLDICQKYLPLHQVTPMVMENTRRATPAEVKQAVADFFKEQKITMADAGVRMGMSRASVSYALGQSDKYFTNAQAVKYARHFKMDTDFLTRGVGELMDRDPRLMRNGSSYMGGRVAFEDMSPDMQRMALNHENYRYKKALSDISDLSVILDVLEKAAKSNEEEFKHLDDEVIEDAVFQERKLIFLRRRNELQSAIRYTMVKINSATGTANSIEEQRMRRDNPELWKKIEEEQKEKGPDSARRRLLEGYLGGSPDTFDDDPSQED